jgi:hypothetical protein
LTTLPATDATRPAATDTAPSSTVVRSVAARRRTRRIRTVLRVTLRLRSSAMTLSVWPPSASRLAPCHSSVTGRPEATSSPV